MSSKGARPVTSKGKSFSDMHASTEMPINTPSKFHNKTEDTIVILNYKKKM